MHDCLWWACHITTWLCYDICIFLDNMPYHTIIWVWWIFDWHLLSHLKTDRQETFWCEFQLGAILRMCWCVMRTCSPLISQLWGQLPLANGYPEEWFHRHDYGSYTCNGTIIFGSRKWPKALDREKTHVVYLCALLNWLKLIVRLFFMTIF